MKMVRTEPTPTPANLVESFLQLWERGGAAPDIFQFLADHPQATAEEQAQICGIDQEHRWRTGEGLPVEQYFDHCPKLRTDQQLGPSLIAGEFHGRRGRGARVAPQEFLERFPQFQHLLRDQLIETAERLQKSGQLAATLIDGRGATEPVAAISNGPFGAANAAPPPSTPAPQTIGRYEVLRILGDGGFGRVYLALDRELQREVAVKVPHAYRIREQHDAAVYLNEARLVAALDHPSIVPVYDFGRTEDGICFSVSKYMRGGNLAQRIRREHYSFTAVAQLLSTICDALHFAHLKGVVHRDVKPGNILLDEHGRPILADFGIALKEEDFGKPGDIMGTPAYMSPEQLRGEGHLVDGRSDIFSLGVVLYEMLSGRRPYPNTKNVLRVDVEPRPVRQIDDSIPSELERICLKALAPRVSDRYRTARDMAEDLQSFADVPTGARARLPLLTPSDTEKSSSDPRSASEALQIVPKGLRSFDQDDASFFLELLPGPRNRQGRPESVHFWIRRIQSQVEQVFRVGLIYGPSGCGKTSFVKAGVIPLLGKDIATAYVEATPHETESRLLKQLRNRCPDLPNDLNLADTLARLRRDAAVRSHRKVLIVIDQFEQWLHSQTDAEQSELVCALRQCDGVSLQAIVVVRDDFWMAVTRFMELLDVALVADGNIQAMDLFSVRHARKVLTALGRSYGALPERDDDITADQKKFIRKAVDDLAHTGQVVPVHLVVFAEMVKDQPWDVRTLRSVGGAEGVGFAFLEETFNGRTANPNHRLHQAGARSVLQALLSDRGGGIKGRMRSYDELFEASGYQPSHRTFDALLRILDTDLRIITPTDPVGLDPSTASSSSGGGRRHYHLTHDYLVPSLEKWLASKQKETRRGRVELLLAERAQVWSAHPRARALPSAGEWLSILAFTSRHSRRKSDERRMMLRAASRHYLLRLAIAIVLLVAVGWWAGRSSQRQQARSLVEAVKVAATSDVEHLIQRLEPVRAWADPMLRKIVKESDSNSREALHARLALLPVDQGQQEVLCDRIHSEGPDALMLISTQLKQHGSHEALARRLRLEFNDPANLAVKRFRAGGALAVLTADDSPAETVWENNASLLADELLKRIAEEPNRISEWTSLLLPIRQYVIPPLTQCYADPLRREVERNAAAAALCDYVDEPEMLTELLLNALPAQHTMLFAKITPGRREVIDGLRTKLSVPAPANSDLTAQTAHLRRRAHIAALLFCMGDHEPAWSSLDSAADPELCAFTEQRLAAVEVDPGVLAEELLTTDRAPLRSALLRTLGAMTRARMPSAVAQQIEEAMVRIHQTDPDAGVHSAASWALRRWNHTVNVDQGSVYDSGSSRTWYVTREGQTMIQFAGPHQAQVGSPESELGRGGDESAQRTAIIPHSFAISATEITMDQYLRFVSANADAPPYRFALNERAPEGTCPVNAVSWLDAVAYCQWLCKQENLPEEEWCFPAGIKLDNGMQLPENFLERTGYRLPTEIEWELTCRAGSKQSYSFGNELELLPLYGWYIENSRGRTWPVGGQKPNAFGLFDMHGNVREWCHDQYNSDMNVHATGHSEPLSEGFDNVTRGGDFASLANETRSANRRGNHPIDRPSYSIGFRVARTLRHP